MAKYIETRAFGTVVLGWRAEPDGVAPTALRFTWTAEVATPERHRMRRGGPLWMVEVFHEGAGEWYAADWRSPAEMPPDDRLMAETEGVYPTEAGALGVTIGYLGAAIERKQHTVDEYRARYNALAARLAELAPEPAGVA